jgi:hypothetical protein
MAIFIISEEKQTKSFKCMCAQNIYITKKKRKQTNDSQSKGYTRKKRERNFDYLTNKEKFF